MTIKKDSSLSSIYQDNLLNFSKKIDWALGCPPDIINAMLMEFKIKDALSNGRYFEANNYIEQTAAFLKAQHQLTSEESYIDSSEVLNLLQQAKDFICIKSTSALAEGKKLLVLIGELHISSQSTLLEFAILSYLKSSNFNSLLVELPENLLEASLSELQQDSFMQMLSGFYLASDVLGYQLHSIDKFGEFANLRLSDTRNNAINQGIAAHGNENQIAIVGAAHLQHILASDEVNDKFIVAAINLDDLKYTSHVLEIFSGSVEPNDVVLKLDLSMPINSFSSKQILAISADLLPVYLGEEDEFENTIYESSEQNNRESCIFYDLYDGCISKYVDDMAA